MIVRLQNGLLILATRVQWDEIGYEENLVCQIIFKSSDHLNVDTCQSNGVQAKLEMDIKLSTQICRDTSKTLEMYIEVPADDVHSIKESRKITFKDGGDDE